MPDYDTIIASTARQWLAKYATLWSYRLAKSLRMLIETRDWVAPDVVEMVTIEPTVWQIWPDVFRKRND
jgi:hypothetical protein